MTDTALPSASRAAKQLAKLDTPLATVDTAVPRPEGGWVVTTEEEVYYDGSGGTLLAVRIVPKTMRSWRYASAQFFEGGGDIFYSLFVVIVGGVGPLVVLYERLAWFYCLVSFVAGVVLPVVARRLNRQVLAKNASYPAIVWERNSMEVTRRAALALFDRVGCSFVEFPADVVRAFNQLVENNETVMSSRLLELLEDDLYADDAVDIIYRLATTSNEKAVVAARNAVNELHFVKCQSKERQREAERVEAAQRREVEERMAQAMEVEQRALAAAQPDYVEDFTTLVNKHRLVEKLPTIQPDDLLGTSEEKPLKPKVELASGRFLNPSFRPGYCRKNHTPIDPWQQVPEARNIHGGAEA